MGQKMKDKYEGVGDMILKIVYAIMAIWIALVVISAIVEYLKTSNDKYIYEPSKVDNTDDFYPQFVEQDGHIYILRGKGMALEYHKTANNDK